MNERVPKDVPLPPQHERAPSDVPELPTSERMKGAWRAWLASLATDADAVTATAHVYGELGADGRDAWLDALEEDVPQLPVPAIAVYGPLFSIEDEPRRLARMRGAVKQVPAPAGCVRRALHGCDARGSCVAVLVMPLYLDFVRVLCFRFRMTDGFEWAQQHAFVRDGHAPHVGDEMDGVTLNRSSAPAVIDELAHAVLAHDRTGGEPPSLLRRCAELFSARVHEEVAGERSLPCG